MATAVNQDKRVEATDIVITAIDQAIDDMQMVRRALREKPGDGIGLSGYAAVASASTARDAMTLYQNDAAECIATYGHLVQ